MTYLAGKVLMGVAKKSAKTMRSFPTEMGMVWIEAMTIELIGLCSMC